MANDKTGVDRDETRESCDGVTEVERDGVASAEVMALSRAFVILSDGSEVAMGAHVASRERGEQVTDTVDGVRWNLAANDWDGRAGVRAAANLAKAGVVGFVSEGRAHLESAGPKQARAIIDYARSVLSGK